MPAQPSEATRMVSKNELATKQAAETRPATADDQVGAELMQAALNVSLNLPTPSTDPTKPDVWGAINNGNLQALLNGLTQLSNQFAQYLPLWQPNTAYAQGALVLGPPGSSLAGQPITANAAHTSGSTITVTNWTAVLSGNYVTGLPDATVNGATPTLAIGVRSTVAAGAACTAPAVPASVATIPARFAVAWPTTGGGSITYPNAAGTSVTTTTLPGETLTFRNVGSGWVAESGNKPLTSLSGIFAPILTAAPVPWAANTAYVKGQTVTQGGYFWTAANSHTSGTTFSGAVASGGNWVQGAPVAPGSGGGSGGGRQVASQPYAATVTPALGTSGQDELLNVGTLTGNVTFAAPTGTLTDGQTLRIRLQQDTSGYRTVTWNTAYAFGTDLTASQVPTQANSACEILFAWYAAGSVWRAIGLVRF